MESLTGPAVSRIVFAAAEEARASGYELILVPHVVMALLSSDDERTGLARSALGSAGISRQDVEAGLERRPALPADRAIGVNLNALTARILGVSEGNALGSGATRTEPEHLVLALAFAAFGSVRGLTTGARRHLVDFLARAGVATPAAAVPKNREY